MQVISKLGFFPSPLGERQGFRLKFAEFNVGDLSFLNKQMIKSTLNLMCITKCLKLEQFDCLNGSKNLFKPILPKITQRLIVEHHFKITLKRFFKTRSVLDCDEALTF